MHWRAIATYAAMALSGCAQAGGEPQCLDLSQAVDKASFSGRLTLQIFPGRPNYESIADGDEEEHAFILELAEPHCAGGDGFIDAGTMFDRVHVSATDPEIRHALVVSIDREIEVSGDVFGSHTGHHHAPLVLFAERVTVLP